MKAETLNKINEALARLEDGRYGLCFECGDEIAEARLRALPFAVRCKDCEEAREMPALQSGRFRSVAVRRASSTTCGIIATASLRGGVNRPGGIPFHPCLGVSTSS